MHEGLKRAMNATEPEQGQKFSFPQMELKLGSEYMLHLTCSTLPSGFGPQKKTPASEGACILRIDLKTKSQFGLPKLVGARSPVMASFLALASLSMMFVASSGFILAVRY